MTFCNEHDGGCGASLTATDYEYGRCTQCRRDLIDDDKEWEDDAILQMDHELIRSELSKD